jgi:hypothetical protein
VQSANTTAAISAVAAATSLASWLTEHAIFFTVAAAIAAILSGLAATFFYCTSIYFKIKYEHKK